MTPRHYGMLFAAVLTAGVIVGAAWPPPPLPKIKQNAAPWSLPEASDLLRHVPQDLAAVISNLHWKGSSPNGEQSAWRLAGIVTKDGPVILVMTSNKPDELTRVAIGAALPDGSLLQSIQGDKAITKRDNCLTTYQLYQAEAVNKSSGCDGPDAPVQGTQP